MFDNDLNIYKKKLPIIELVDLVKKYGNKTILKGLNLSINKGEFITLLGPSGSGKTTALRLIGGFEKPTRGEIKINGIDVKDMPPYKRPTKTIFQDYALFPHLTVEGNIKYGLNLIKVDKKNIDLKKIQKLKKLKNKWLKYSNNKMQKLDFVQKKYQDILNNLNKNNKKYKRARRWLDSSDFKYSYWENYLQNKIELFKNKYMRVFLNKEQIKYKVSQIIKMIGLEGNSNKNINQLSGGMKQRVALARSIILEPKILLLDEPLSALDLKVRQKMQRELKNIQKKLNMTFIFVTHDQEEAMTISDKVVVMKGGIIQQVGTPQEVYDYPVNKWVASFIGESNQFVCQIINKNTIKLLNKQIKVLNHNFENKEKVDVVIRPEDIIISSEGFFKGKIIQRIYQGSLWEYKIHTDQFTFISKSTKEYKINSLININFHKKDIHLMKK